MDKKDDKVIRDKQKKESNKLKYKDRLLEFFNKHILKKFIILLIIAVILVITTTQFMYQVNKVDVDNGLVLNEDYIGMFKSKLYALGLTAIAGCVPYFFVPAVGFAIYISTTGSEISMKLLGIGGIDFSIFSIIPIILDIIAISLVTSIGIYYAVVATKRFRYSGIKRFTFLDFKLQTYEIMKKEDKVEAIKAKIAKRDEKHEKYNVKIKYLEMIGMFVIAAVIQAVSVLLESFIR